MLAAQARERGGRGAEDSDVPVVGGLVERAPDFGGRRLHARQVIAVDEQRGERDVGRVAEAAAVVDSSSKKPRSPARRRGAGRSGAGGRSV